MSKKMVDEIQQARNFFFVFGEEGFSPTGGQQRGEGTRGETEKFFRGPGLPASSLSK